MPSSIGFPSPSAREYNYFIRWTLPGEHAYMYGLAIIPAFLLYILLYVEVEMPELILARRERGMRKPFGFNWDLLLIGLLTMFSSIFGLPWMCAACVQSLTHGHSLTIMQKAAPGQTPKVDKVVEQRLTTVCICALIGKF